MKANEAPKKLYVNFHFIETHPGSHQPLVTKQGINKYDIEYTRTDVFIEKACEFVRNNIDKQLTIYHEQTWCKRDEFINRFKKYLKGE